MDNAKTNTQKITNTSAEAVQVTWYQALVNGCSNLFSYGYAGLKVIDVVARILTAAALYLKLNETMLNWGAAFLAATAVWEIVVALLRTHAPSRDKR